MNGKNVFINCPFDNQYFPLLKALFFTIVYIGLKSLISETSDSGEIRLHKIKDLMLESQYSIHDLSRIEPLKDGDLPRFNMPYGEVHTSGMVGVRTHAEGMDSAENFIKWIWDSKDYLKKRAESVGKKGARIEEYVNQNFFLSVCADLANGLKRGGLDKSRKSRSQMSPRLGQVSFTFPQAAIESLVFGDHHVAVNVSNPDKV
jgi:hypothetical protein